MEPVQDIERIAPRALRNEQPGAGIPKASPPTWPPTRPPTRPPRHLPRAPAWPSATPGWRAGWRARGAARMRERVEAFVGGALRRRDRGAPVACGRLLEVAKEAGAERRRGRSRRSVAEELETGAREGAQTPRARSGSMRSAARSAARARARWTSRCASRRLWLRDVWCVAEGAGELVYAVDRRTQRSSATPRAAPPRGCARAVELVQDTRLRLPLNVSEELALEALAYRLQALLAAPG